MDGSKTITIKISPVGDVVIEADGFSGAGCVEATKGIEVALGGGAGVERTHKSDYNESDTGVQEEVHQTW